MASENNSLTFSDMKSFIFISAKKKMTPCTFIGKRLHHTNNGPKGSHGTTKNFFFTVTTKLNLLLKLGT